MVVTHCHCRRIKKCKTLDKWENIYIKKEHFIILKRILGGQIASLWLHKDPFYSSVYIGERERKSWLGRGVKNALFVKLE